MRTIGAIGDSFEFTIVCFEGRKIIWMIIYFDSLFHYIYNKYRRIFEKINKIVNQ
jgi:hypothetical protein